MYRIENLKVEELNIEEYVTVYPGTATRYVDWRLQQLWFRTKYPNGCIITSAPQPDPYKAPNTWIATTVVYLNKDDEKEAIRVSEKRGPKDIEENGGDEYIDPYKLCQIASISEALSGLGFCPAVMTNAEKEDFMMKTYGAPNTAEEPAKTEETSQAPVEVPTQPVEVSAPVVAEEPVEAPATPEPEKAPEVKTEEKVEPKKKRGRPSKADIAAREEAVKQEAEKQEEKAETEPTTAPKAAQPTEATSTSFASVDDARRVKCTYRNYSGMTIGEIVDKSKTERGYKSMIEWYNSSPVAQRKFPQETEAVKFILENEA